ncbi:class 1 fructose-bisphosphatase [Thermodesulfovibrio sp. 3907-1M]|uniref:Fructose-1,6-bisphosphatase class 1 n=1 Tax=Thermodesulfovibrio autotrophicus TaxID=3118333 RepID=A0AAU8GXQ0_9BACT
MEIKKGIDLNRFILEEERKHPEATGTLSHALMAIENATKIISSYIRMAGLVDVIGKTGRINVQGEEVQKLDTLSNRVLIEHLSGSGDFYAVASEEMEHALFPEEGKDGKYIIAIDPLDGSSVIDANTSVGTIFSIWRKTSSDESTFLQEGKKIVAAGYVIYGTSTMLVYSTGNGVYGFTLDPMVGTYLLSHPDIKIPEKGKIYGFNESYYNKWDERIRKCVDFFKTEGYTLRWAGAMVTDIHRTIMKGGIFAYPLVGSKAKIRLLYEAAPMAFLVKQAGGLATNGTEDILNIKPQALHQRVPVFMGSSEDVKKCMEIINS